MTGSGNIIDIHAEGFGQGAHGLHAAAAHAGLDLADVEAVEAGAFRQFGLSQTAMLAEHLDGVLVAGQAVDDLGGPDGAFFEAAS